MAALSEDPRRSRSHDFAHDERHVVQSQIDVVRHAAASAQSELGVPEAQVHAPLEMLGRYEILGKIGTGGMATVYLARSAGDLGFQRLCAVKVLHPHLAEEPGFIQMLLDEAQIAARIHHPNVVPIVDLGTHGATRYVAMEYVEGCALSALLRKQPDQRRPRLLVPIVLDALAGLDAAHSLADDDGKLLQVVHRDVSPQNVLIGIDGTARITDFGIARARSRITSTIPGQIKGKFAYMSPEQVRAGGIDRRSDVFSAGVMLWTLLTGRKLFVGDTDEATLKNVLHMEIPPPSGVGCRPPAVFDAVCLRALERDPAKRFQSAQDMEAALRAAAIEVDALGTTREVGEWVGRAFGDAFAARRHAIRAAATGPSERTPSGRILRPTPELPSFTPSRDSSAELAALAPPRMPRDATTIADPEPADADAPIITIAYPDSPDRGRRRALWATVVVAAIASALWLVPQWRHSNAQRPAPARVETSATQPVPPPTIALPPAPTPTPTPMPNAAPSATPGATPEPEIVPTPAPVTEPAAPRPKVEPHARPHKRRAGPAKPPSAMPPPPPPTTSLPPTPPPQPTKWDPDSPLPP
jgi:serine/threonine-protein kinase